MKTLPILALLMVMVNSHQAQNLEVIATDLLNPIGIEADSEGNLWIAESGSGQNDGGVTVVWSNGTTERVITNLPSKFDSSTMFVAGPNRVQHFNDQFFGVLMDSGSPEYAGSILVFSRDSVTLGEPPLTGGHMQHEIRIRDQLLKSGLAGGNGYSFVHLNKDLYIADAARNAILHRDGLTGVVSVFVDFSQIPNPLPIGPLTVDAVPTRIIHDPAGGFLVSGFTGFPFGDGTANIYHVS